jgi:hypothetical protein
LRMRAMRTDACASIAWGSGNTTPDARERHHEGLSIHLEIAATA